MSRKPDASIDADIIAVVGVILRADDHVLLAIRPPQATMPGVWEFPGGKVEPDEDFASALVRELHEELNITATEMEPYLQLTHDFPDRRVYLDVWLVHAFEGEPIGKEQQHIEWVPMSKLKQLTFPSANTAIIDALQLSASKRGQV